MQRLRRVPEVVQASAMDCGPAAAAAMLSGFGVHCDIETLRARCATDVDGTSVDALELVLTEFGLPSEEVVVPVDHLLLAEAAVLPAIVVVLQPDGAAHFVVVWRRRSRHRLEIMDPAVGRRVVPVSRFLATVYRHDLVVPEAAWFEWATGPEGLGALHARLAATGVAARDLDDLAEQAVTAGPAALAALDAATRVVARLREAGALAAGRAGGLLRRLAADPEHLPDEFRSVRAVDPPTGTEPDPDAPDRWVGLRGAVAVRIQPHLPAAADSTGETTTGDDTSGDDIVATAGRARSAAPPRRRGRGGSMWRRVAREVWALPAARTAAVLSVLAGMGFVAEAVALQRLLADGIDPCGFAVVIAVVVVELLVGCAAAAAARNAGRRLEQSLHERWSQRLRTTAASWVATRPVSDLIERVHGLHRARALPQVCGVALRAVGTIVAAAVVLAVVIPAAATAVILLVALPVVAVRVGWARVNEFDLRARTLAGSLSRFLLDGLLGLTAIRHHHAGLAVRWEHGRFLAQWRTAARGRVRATAIVELGVGLAVLGPAALLLATTAAAALPPATTLMILLLGLSIPMAVDELMTAGRLLPDARNRLLRFLEILDAPPETAPHHDPRPGPGHASPAGLPPTTDDPADHAADHAADPADGARPPARTASRRAAARNVSAANGAELVWCAASVSRAGHPVITDLSLLIRAGERVAVVGRSGSAKSTLLDTLLGLVDVVDGDVTVDGIPVAADPARVRAMTAWASSAAALWDRSIDVNVALPHPVDPEATEQATRRVGADVLRTRLRPAPDRPIGAGGRLLSGGEGQLVRAARTAKTGPVRLLLADEATRGIDRAARRRLLHGLRAAHPTATVVWVTHDPAEATEFDRVLVLAAGNIVQDGPPADLAHTDGPFADLLATAAAAADPPGWRRVAFDDCQHPTIRPAARPLAGGR